eukprot:scaffold14391_cov116-Isochrysis_galbana.AAC.6
MPGSPGQEKVTWALKWPARARVLTKKEALAFPPYEYDARQFSAYFRAGGSEARRKTSGSTAETVA